MSLSKSLIIILNSIESKMELFYTFLVTLGGYNEHSLDNDSLSMLVKNPLSWIVLINSGLKFLNFRILCLNVTWKSNETEKLLW